MTAIPHPRFRVQWKEDTGFEMQCLRCETYWPMTLEHWGPKAYGLRMCRACVLSVMARRRVVSRKKEKASEWYKANRERINAQRRARQAARTEEQLLAARARSAEWRERNRELLRIYNRQWRADRKRLAA